MQTINSLDKLRSLPRGTKFNVRKTKNGPMDYILTLDFVKDTRVYFKDRNGNSKMQDADEHHFEFFGLGYRLRNEKHEIVWEAHIVV